MEDEEEVDITWRTRKRWIKDGGRGRGGYNMEDEDEVDIRWRTRKRWI